MDKIPALLKDWMASLRRLAAGPATLERTLTLTLGGLVLAAILVLAPCFAQTAGTIEGVVLDPSHAPVYGCQVKIVEPRTAFSRSVETVTGPECVCVALTRICRSAKPSFAARSLRSARTQKPS